MEQRNLGKKTWAAVKRFFIEWAEATAEVYSPVPRKPRRYPESPYDRNWLRRYVIPRTKDKQYRRAKF